MKYRQLEEGTVAVDGNGACGMAFDNVVQIIESESENPGIRITTSSGIIGSNLLRQVLEDVAAGRNLES